MASPTRDGLCLATATAPALHLSAIPEEETSAGLNDDWLREVRVAAAVNADGSG